MVKTEETTLDGKRIQVVQLPARRALALKTKLLKLFAAPVARLIGTNPIPSVIANIEKQVNMANIAPAIEQLVGSLEPNAFFSLIIECFASTKVEGDNGNLMDVNEQSFDLIFSGNLPFMYGALWFTLKVNFADFFGEKGIGKVLNSAPQMPVSLKPSQK